MRNERWFDTLLDLELVEAILDDLVVRHRAQYAGADALNVLLGHLDQAVARPFRRPLAVLSPGQQASVRELARETIARLRA